VLLRRLQIFCWLLPPSRIKNWVLARFGHDIAASAKIGPTIVLGVKHFHLGEHAWLSPVNVFRGLSTVWIEDYSKIGAWNWISAAPEYQQLDADAGTLVMGVKSLIGSRCYLDCSGTIAIRAFGCVGGVRCVLQTHQPDFDTSAQTAGRITVGDHALVASGAMMLKGSALPDQSVLAANSTMTPDAAREGKRGLYAGTPARWRQERTGAFFERLTYWLTENVIDGEMGIMPDDIDPSYKTRIVGAPE
jgi:acetyltransferase-like isoleucine patch superfamily enzyme